MKLGAWPFLLALLDTVVGQTKDNDSGIPLSLSHVNRTYGKGYVRRSDSDGSDSDDFVSVLALLDTVAERTEDNSSGIPSSPSHGNRTYGKGYVRRSDYNGFVSILHWTQRQRESARKSIDWTFQTSAVKNQGYCGSCWAYATTEGVETAVFFGSGEKGAVPLFSEQQIISCDTLDGGCRGGDPGTALKYLASVGRIDTQWDYPDSSSDQGVTGRCAWDRRGHPVQLKWWYAVKPCAWGDCSSQDEDGLAAAMSSYGPLTICLNANWPNYEDWQHDGSVYRGKGGTCSSSLKFVDHCVQLVGYNKAAWTPFWRIRNSWGSDWGDGGYLNIPYGENYCGVANEAYLIQVDSGLQTPRAIPGSIADTLMV